MCGKTCLLGLLLVGFDALFQQLSDMIIINGERGELMRKHLSEGFPTLFEIGIWSCGVKPQQMMKLGKFGKYCVAAYEIQNIVLLRLKSKILRCCV